MPSWIAGLIKPVTETVGGIIQKRAENRQALAQAGFDARLSSWTDDYLVYLITSPILFLVVGAVARLFDDALGERVQVSGEQLVESLGALLGDSGWYGYMAMTVITVGLGLQVGSRVTDRAIKKKVDQL